MSEAGGEALLVAGYHGARAGALFDGVSIVTARTSVQFSIAESGRHTVFSQPRTRASKSHLKRRR